MSEEPLPPEILLDDYPPDIQAVANALRAVVMTAVPDAIERVRVGWRLIGYDVPAGRRTRYFAFVVPEPAHVHLGFEYGILMSDPQRLLHGAELKLRKVRYFTFEPGDPIPERRCGRVRRGGGRTGDPPQRLTSSAYASFSGSGSAG